MKFKTNRLKFNRLTSYYWPLIKYIWFLEIHQMEKINLNSVSPPPLKRYKNIYNELLIIRTLREHVKCSSYTQFKLILVNKILYLKGYHMFCHKAYRVLFVVSAKLHILNIHFKQSLQFQFTLMPLRKYSVCFIDENTSLLSFTHN